MSEITLKEFVEVTSGLERQIKELREEVFDLNIICNEMSKVAGKASFEVLELRDRMVLNDAETYNRLKALEDEVFDENGIPHILPRLDELERLHKAHDHPITGPAYTGIPSYLRDRIKPANQPPERPGAVVCGNCKHLTIDRMCGISPLPRTRQTLLDKHYCSGWEKKYPPECLCDARKREEEAGMIWFGETQCFKGDRTAKWCCSRYDTCIHCNKPILRSLLEEEK